MSLYQLINNSSLTCLFGQHDYNVAGYSISFIYLLINVVVGLPANAWVVWIICHGNREILASEIFLLSLAVCEILYCLALPAQLYCIFGSEPAIYEFSILLLLWTSLVWIGRPIFQCCICWERYMAVVHPLIFIRLKPLQYRVAQCTLAWCVFFLTIVLMWMLPPQIQFGMIWFVPSLCILLYCSISVLCSLKRPGPGEKEGEQRRRGDKMKRKAFNIILINLVCFLVNYLLPAIPEFFREQIHDFSFVKECVTRLAMFCGLVQPFLYLHRAGKLSYVKRALTCRLTNI